MKIFVESTWAPWIPCPQDIDQWHELVNNDRVGSGHVDLCDHPDIAPAIANGDFSIYQQHPLDYLIRNSDFTVSIGFYQPKREAAQRWVELCQDRLRPGQIEHVLVVIPEEGDDPTMAQLSYGDRLAAGLIDPFFDTIDS